MIMKLPLICIHAAGESLEWFVDGRCSEPVGSAGSSAAEQASGADEVE